MTLRVITQPSSEPIDLDSAKLYLRVDHDDEDDLIKAFISSAREYCEGYQNRSYITQQLELTMDHFPGCAYHRYFADDLAFDHTVYRRNHTRRHEISLLRPPIQSVESITYTDDTGAVTTLDPSSYVVDTESDPGRIVPAIGHFWPRVRLQPINGVAVTYTAGYGDADAVPETVKQAMLMLIGHWYENRSAVIVSNYRQTVGASIDFAVKALLAPQRVIPT